MSQPAPGADHDQDALAAHHRQAYDNAVGVRDGLHADVIAEANARRDEVLAAIEAVRTGRLSAKEARSGLRDIIADHDRLTEKHVGIESSEDRLAEFDEMDPEEHQSATLQRFPMLGRASSPDFTAMIGEPGKTRRPTGHIDRAQLDADQDALIRALPGGNRSTGSDMRP